MNVYHDQKLIREELQPTLGQFVRMARLEPGMLLTVAKAKLGSSPELRKIIIGHATLHHMPTNTDAGIGWDYSAEANQDVVISVQTFSVMK